MRVKNKDTGEVHKGSKGSKTRCGYDTSGSNWVNTSEKITCGRDACKN